MKITCQTEALHSAFQIVGSVVQPRPTRPILATVLLTANDQGLEIHATDLEIGIRLTVPEVVFEEQGSVAVPQARVAPILRETSDENITLYTDDHHCIISASDSTFRLPTEGADEFPDIPEFDDENAIEFDRGDLVEMVSKTVFAAHKGKHRYALNGVLLELQEKKNVMVATDGRRLAHIERKAKNPDGTEKSVIIPTKALDQLIRVLTDEDEKIRVNIQENQLVARTSRAVRAADERGLEFDRHARRERTHAGDVIGARNRRGQGGTGDIVRWPRDGPRVQSRFSERLPEGCRRRNRTGRVPRCLQCGPLPSREGVPLRRHAGQS
jgi:DNA polymerase-3 subunit beta